MAFITYSSVPLTLEIHHKCLLTGKDIFLGLQRKMIELQSEFCLQRRGRGKAFGLASKESKLYACSSECGQWAIGLLKM